MKIRFNLNTKLLFYILTASAVIYIIAFGYLIYISRQSSFVDATNYINSTSEKYAKYSKTKLDGFMQSANSLSLTMSKYNSIPKPYRRQFFNEIIKHHLQKNEDFLSVWTIWEPNVFDSLDAEYAGKTGHSQLGNYYCGYFKDVGQIKFEPAADTNKIKPFTQSYYVIPKKNRAETVMEPYFHSYSQYKADEQLLTSHVAPIMVNDKFLGVIGIDLSLENFQKIIDEIHPYEETKAFFIANKGCYVAHSIKEYAGKLISEINPEFNEQNKILEKIQKGEEISFIYKDSYSFEKYYCNISPVYIGNYTEPWAIGIVVPFKSFMKETSYRLWASAIIGLLGIILLFIIIYRIARKISKPLALITELLHKVSKGEIADTEEIKIQAHDEIAVMADAVNSLVGRLRVTSDFAKKIGEGDLDAEFNPISNKDVLGISLIEMKKSLKISKEEEAKRKQEDEKRNWATNGLAKFGDILRQNNDDLKELAYDIIKNLVKYLNINQGGIFILNDDDKDDKFLELAACYAFDRRKFTYSRIDIGEGIVGTCYIEGKTIYLTKIPDTYIAITSGLGKANPSALLVVPLRLNEGIFGILELASFFPLEQHQIDFIEKVAENIAATISTVKINVRTAYLLEQSQQQAEELKAQEEEMRQNMEELHATQEEISRKNAEAQSVMNGVNSTLAICEYNMEEELIRFNENFIKISNLKASELTNIAHSKLLLPQYIEDGTYEEIWNKLRFGKSYSGYFRYLFNTREIWTQETLTPIKNEYGDAYKVMDFIVDITEQKMLELQTQRQLREAKELEENLRSNMEELHATQEEMKQKEIERQGILDALNNSTNMVEYDLLGNIIFVNNSYLNLLNMQKEEVLGKHHSYKIEFKDDKQKRIYEQFWNDLANGVTKKEINRFNVDGRILWLMETYTPIFNNDGMPYKVLKIALDITESKNLEHELHQQAEEVKAQQEELRQNMEEISSIQDSISLKSKEIDKLQEEIHLKTTKLESLQEKINELQEISKIKEKKHKEELEVLNKKIDDLTNNK